MKRDKHAREAKLLDELSRKHGYTLLEMRSKRDRVGMLFDRTLEKIAPCVVVRLAVPVHSALGKAFVESRKALPKGKAK